MISSYLPSKRAGMPAALVPMLIISSALHTHTYRTCLLDVMHAHQPRDAVFTVCPGGTLGASGRAIDHIQGTGKH